MQALSKITSTGAMTYCFIQAIENGQSATYGDILNSMRNAIRKVGKDNNNKAISAASSLVNVLTSSNKASSLVKMVMSGGNLGLGLKQVPLPLPLPLLFHYFLIFIFYPLY